jgi:methyl coenzyme M reductase subunit C-like uncharacterized protein (methanogenesis marker protein 7)
MFHCLEELEEHGYKIILVAKSETDFAIISYGEFVNCLKKKKTAKKSNPESD